MEHDHGDTLWRDAAVERVLGPESFEYAVPVALEDGRATPLDHADSPQNVYERTFDPSVRSSITRTTRADGVVLVRGPLSEGADVDVVPYPVIE